MSGTAPDPADQETELLAAEYVLGTLERADRLAVEREAEGSAMLRGAIADWERRLAPLSDLAPTATPPAALWPRIETSAWSGRASGAQARPSRPAPPSRGLRLWQGAATAGFALAAGIAAFAVLRAPSVRPTPAPVQVTALLPVGQATGFVAEALPDGALRVTPVGPVHVAAGRDLELWLLKDGETRPRALGVLPAGGIQLASGALPPASGGRVGARILISLEPRGGSPTGQPTGPVLWGGGI